MKMKRYVAADMRAALKAIRDEQGPDAVILSTRASSQGVEVCAAVDVELAAEPGSAAETAALKQLERTALAELSREAADSARTLRAESGASATVVNDEQQLLAALASADGATPSVGDELRSLRALLEQQLAALAWNDFTRREPLKARALTELATLGLDRVLALSIVGDLPAGLSSEQAQRLPYGLLARRLRVAEPPVERAGTLALIGAPGSGKTTTLSKLAARYVLEQDPANLLIISTDEERLGSQEQLRSLGRVLGVRVEGITDPAALAARVEALPGRCILIDTPGVATRDADAGAAHRALRERIPALKSLLVLPASAQSGVIDDTLAHFGPGVADGCILTRIDEAVSLGGLLSALVRSQLPAVYCSEGPRIPEDLRPARAHQLVARAVELARVAHACADDDLLARRYGGSVHAAA